MSITFLSECHRLKTNQQLQVNNHEIFIHGESSSTGGVGIVLNKHATHAWKLAGLQPPVTIKGRIMDLHLEFGHGKKCTKFFVVSTYLPCTVLIDHDFDTILDDLAQLIKQECKKGVKPMIGGDFKLNTLWRTLCQVPWSPWNIIRYQHISTIKVSKLLPNSLCLQPNLHLQKTGKRQ